MSDNTSKRVKNPNPPAETPVQIKKRIKATASPTLAAQVKGRVKAGSSAPAASLPSESGTPKKTTAKKTAAKKTAPKVGDNK